ncbi:MAG: hypothetical protein JNJ64_12115 [Flavobacteriales bacterium]|nr:hypothetical protein [Flavobacteriales bacterium]
MRPHLTALLLSTAPAAFAQGPEVTSRTSLRCRPAPIARCSDARMGA